MPSANASALTETDRAALTRAREAARAREDRTGLLVFPHAGASQDDADRAARALADHMDGAQDFTFDLRPR